MGMSNVALLAIDQGTTSSRAILFSAQGEILSLHQQELALHYPHKGWVEQDPRDIWRDTLKACRAVLREGKDLGVNVAGIGITNQRETTIIWDRVTGEPVYNAIVWQDRRTADFCKALKKQGHERDITAKTGLLLDPYFSASKIAWILDHVEGARGRAERGELAFGTIDTYLLWNLTGGKSHASDATNAARTMLYNIVEHKWDEDLLALFNIPRALLPEVHDNVAAFGTSAPDLLDGSYVIGGMAGDQQAALIGQACFERGMVKATYGTGCFMLENIGEDFVASQNRLLTTLAYRLEGRSVYALEGSIFTAGAAVQWLRDGLGLFKEARESEALARSVPDNNGVYFVPAFTGLGAPHWQPEARAQISGLTRESTGAHITRAALEAQAYQTRDLMSAFEKDRARADRDSAQAHTRARGEYAAFMRIDGGLANNAFMCQFLADMLDRPVEVPRMKEATAWGAACLAGLQAGVFKGLDDIAERWTSHQYYKPDMDAERRDKLYAGWKTAIEKLI